MEISHYSPEAFNSLPSLFAARTGLEQHRETIRRLGEVIGRHDLQDVVGIALLHRHFEIARDERIVERINRGRSESVARAETQGEATVPHLFRFSAEGWRPIEFLSAEDAARNAIAETLERVAAGPTFLREFANVLVQDGAVDVFGVGLFHGREQLVSETDGILVERTDVAGRASVVRAESTRAVAGLDVTETLWLWDGKTPRLTCVCTGKGDDHAHIDKQ